MSDAPLTRQRCWAHPAREAAARCPACARFYCRECVTEHAGRVLCAGCLRAARRPAPAHPAVGRPLALAARAVPFTVGVAAAWLFFYLLAQMLVATPSAFHEGSLWAERFLAPASDD